MYSSFFHLTGVSQHEVATWGNARCLVFPTRLNDQVLHKGLDAFASRDLAIISGRVLREKTSHRLVAVEIPGGYMYRQVQSGGEKLAIEESFGERLLCDDQS